MTRPAFIATLLFLSITAHAAPGDSHIIVHGISHHSIKRERGPSWNESNPGMGLRHEVTQTLSLQVGAYKNSYYRQSVYGVADWTPLNVGAFHAGGFLGFASGYADKAGVAGGGLVRWQGDRISVALRVVPAKCKIYTLEIGYRF